MLPKNVLPEDGRFVTVALERAVYWRLQAAATLGPLMATCLSMYAQR